MEVRSDGEKKEKEYYKPDQNHKCEKVQDLNARFTGIKLLHLFGREKMALNWRFRQAEAFKNFQVDT